MAERKNSAMVAVKKIGLFIHDFIVISESSSPMNSDLTNCRDSLQTVRNKAMVDMAERIDIVTSLGKWAALDATGPQLVEFSVTMAAPWVAFTAATKVMRPAKWQYLYRGDAIPRATFTSKLTDEIGSNAVQKHLASYTPGEVSDLYAMHGINSNGSPFVSITSDPLVAEFYATQGGKLHHGFVTTFRLSEKESRLLMKQGKLAEIFDNNFAIYFPKTQDFLLEAEWLFVDTIPSKFIYSQRQVSTLNVKTSKRNSKPSSLFAVSAVGSTTSAAVNKSNASITNITSRMDDVTSPDTTKDINKDITLSEDGRYLNPGNEVCKKLGVPESGNTVEIFVYDNGKFQIATHGENNKRYDKADLAGHYISRKTCHIPAAFFTQTKKNHSQPDSDTAANNDKYLSPSM
jgi:hypothetical protein